MLILLRIGRTVSTPIPVSINGTNGISLAAILDSGHLPRSTVAGRAVKFLAAMWLLAALSFIIPIVHFISIPILFFVGIVGAVYLLNRRHIICGKVECPGCHRSIEVQSVLATERVRWPLDFICQDCGQYMWAEPAQDQPAAEGGSVEPGKPS